MNRFRFIGDNASEPRMICIKGQIVFPAPGNDTGNP